MKAAPFSDCPETIDLVKYHVEITRRDAYNAANLRLHTSALSAVSYSKVEYATQNPEYEPNEVQSMFGYAARQHKYRCGQERIY